MFHTNSSVLKKWESCPTGNKQRKRNQNETEEFAEVEESVTEVHMESSSVKKKKEKKSKCENEAAPPDTLNFDSTDTATVPHKNKKSRNGRKGTLLDYTKC